MLLELPELLTEAFEPGLLDASANETRELEIQCQGHDCSFHSSFCFCCFLAFSFSSQWHCIPPFAASQLVWAIGIGKHSSSCGTSPPGT
jgi:hypothetical protein